MLNRYLNWAVLLVVVCPGAVAAAENVEREMIRRAPDIVQTLQKRGYHNVGVLKFLVAKGKGNLSDNTGTLNLTLANRLEIALILKDNPRDPLGIIHRASTVAAATPGANHLKSEGRRKLFEPLYPLAWGKKQVKADAFLTGMAQVSSDLRTIQVDLLIFDAKNTHLKLLGESFTAANEPQKLSEMGESFLLRGVFDDPSREPGTLKTKALQQASRVHRNEARPPLKEGDAPVKLTILYDGKVVPIEYREGRAFVPECRKARRWPCA